jgi:hypothetical protein
MTPRSSSTVIVQIPTKRHHANTRTAIIKTTPIKHHQISSLKANNLDIKKFQQSKLKPSTAMSRTITSTPSIALLLDACHTLDRLICGPTTPASEIQEWHSLDAWKYLSSAELILNWKTSLEMLCEDFLNGTLTPDVFEAKLMALLPGLKKLEEARWKVSEDLEGELNARGVWVVVPDAFWEVVEERVDVIAEVFEEMGRMLDAQ